VIAPSLVGLALIAFASAAIGPRQSTPELPGQVLDVTADKYFFRAPATARPGLTTIRLHSPHGGHQLQLFRLEGGHSVADLVKASAADAPTPWAKAMGGPGFPPMGGTVNATYILEPGTYAILCAVHEPDGLRHYQKGMFAQMSVAGQRVAGTLPTPDVVVTEVNYKWKFSRPLSAGRHVVRVTNAGTVFHEMKILRLLPGHTYADAKAWNRGEPRVDETVATVTTMAPGVSVITSIDFPPGDYLLFCVPQVKHGMTQAFTVLPAAKAH
jgi:hypothetical protein